MILFRNKIFFLLLILFSCSNEGEVNKLIISANDFKDKQNYSSALSLLNKALSYEKNDERKAMICRKIALIHIVKDKKSDALIYLKKGIEISEKYSYYNNLNRVEIELLGNNIKKAKDILYNLKVEYPDSMEIYQILSLIYYGSFNLDDENMNLSLKFAKKAYELNSNIVNTEQLASIYFFKDEYIKSAELFKKLMKSNPENKKYQFNYGQSIYFAGNENVGIREMQEASERDSECKKLLNEIIKK